MKILFAIIIFIFSDKTFSIENKDCIYPLGLTKEYLKNSAILAIGKIITKNTDFFFQAERSLKPINKMVKLKIPLNGMVRSHYAIKTKLYNGDRILLRSLESPLSLIDLNECNSFAQHLDFKKKEEFYLKLIEGKVGNLNGEIYD